MANPDTNSNLRQLVRATSQLQEQVRSAVQRLEQSESRTEANSYSSCGERVQRTQPLGAARGAELSSRNTTRNELDRQTMGE